MKQILSIQGGQGSYSHQAAMHMFGEDLELLERERFDEVFEDVSGGRAAFAVIPSENSTHGSVVQNYDLLVKHHLAITQELFLRIHFHLIGLPGSRLEHITDVFTHPVSVAQIQGFLKRNPQMRVHEYPDNGMAVGFVKGQGDHTQAAAASRLAAELHGMEILQTHLEDNPQNYTRFFALAIQPAPAAAPDKTSLVFTLKHEAGSLVKVLSVFSQHRVSISKIESRPIHDTKWEYRFYVDLLAGLGELEGALDEIRALTTSLRVLGTYASGDYRDT